MNKTTSFILLTALLSPAVWAASCPSVTSVQKGCDEGDCKKISFEDENGKWAGSQSGLISRDINHFLQATRVKMYGGEGINCTYKTRGDGRVNISFLGKEDKLYSFKLSDKWLDQQDDIAICTATSHTHCSFEPKIVE